MIKSKVLTQNCESPKNDKLFFVHYIRNTVEIRMPRDFLIDKAKNIDIPQDQALGMTRFFTKNIRKYRRLLIFIASLI